MESRECYGVLPYGVFTPSRIIMNPAPTSHVGMAMSAAWRDRGEKSATAPRQSQFMLSAIIRERLWAALAGYDVGSIAGLSLAEVDLP